MATRLSSSRNILPFLCLSGMVLSCGGDGGTTDPMTMDQTPKVNPFAAKPECTGDKVDFKKGQRSLVVSNLEIAAGNQGIDLDGDGKPDNKLGAVSSLANPELEGTFKEKHDVMIPMEFFGSTSGDSQCTKFAMYLGQFLKDRDGDGKDSSWETEKNGTSKGDCNDYDKNVAAGKPEVAGNRMDDDCDGFADNPTQKTPASDASAKMDLDGDGVTVAEGDCDDRATSPMIPTDEGMTPLAKLRHPAKMAMSIAAGTERCDGVDYNCDGIPDNAAQCNPFADANVKIDVQKVALDAQSQPVLSFKNGTVKGNKLSAGPSVFRVAVPISDQSLELELSGARVRRLQP